MIPQTFTVFNFTIPTLVVFLIVGFFVFGFLLWMRGKREGFDEEKIFDLFFLSGLVVVIGSKFDILYAIGALLLIILILSYLWRWSLFRLSDLYILSALAGSALPLSGLSLLNRDPLYVAGAGAALILFLIFSFTRTKLKSGYTFSAILFISTVFGLLLERSNKYLIFYGYLFIITAVNIYLRERKSMDNSILPVKLLNKLKNELLAKRKKLKAEQKILMQEDSYMQQGRDRDNAELLDEVMLEDQPKMEQELRVSAIGQMQIQIRKALARMKLGKYGYCEVCGRPIDKARLEAFPAATTCFEHAPKA